MQMNLKMLPFSFSHSTTAIFRPWTFDILGNLLVFLPTADLWRRWLSQAWLRGVDIKRTSILQCKQTILMWITFLSGEIIRYLLFMFRLKWNAKQDKYNTCNCCSNSFKSHPGLVMLIAPQQLLHLYYCILSNSKQVLGYARMLTPPWSEQCSMEKSLQLTEGPFIWRTKHRFTSGTNYLQLP